MKKHLSCLRLGVWKHPHRHLRPHLQPWEVWEWVEPLLA